jgi:hypothetical protein
MDTTVALIFSLGLAFSGQDTPAAGHQTTVPNPAQNTKLAQRQHKVRQRIKLTNAWLKKQKQARRALALARQPRPAQTQIASTSSSCTADWDVV